jgi:hypothetical protein
VVRDVEIHRRRDEVPRSTTECSRYPIDTYEALKRHAILENITMKAQ